MSAWRLERYSSAVLCQLIAEYSGNEEERVKASLHALYFTEYFAKLSAATIIAELKYIDRDFLDDFAAYYVRCFQEYPRHCARLHFFNAEITAAELERLLDGLDVAVAEETKRTLADCYLGFIVIRPLPEHPIGRTCLRTYPREGRREFPITRQYTANLFGLELQVHTLAFQEQDNVVAACATSALWSAFQGTGVVFHHRIPSPIEITRSATSRLPDETRFLPSSGLTTAQMADAIRDCDLEPFMMRPAQQSDLMGAVRGYLLGRVPVLLVGAVFRRDDFCAAGDQCDYPRAELGVHSVAVTGFACSADVAPDQNRFCLEADALEKLYCHDDRVGPFARMEPLFLDIEEKRLFLSTSSSPTNEEIGTLVFQPEGVLIPLYHKIRVPYVRVRREVEVFDEYLRWIRKESGATHPVEPLVWDIRLTTTNELKGEWMTDATLTGRRRLLENPLPRFIWLARGRTADRKSIDLVFDATGLEAANLCVTFAERSYPLLSTVASVTKSLAELPFEEFPGCAGILNTLTRAA